MSVGENKFVELGEVRHSLISAVLSEVKVDAFQSCSSMLKFKPVSS